MFSIIVGIRFYIYFSDWNCHNMKPVNYRYLICDLCICIAFLKRNDLFSCVCSSLSFIKKVSALLKQENYEFLILFWMQERRMKSQIFLANSSECFAFLPGSTYNFVDNLRSINLPLDKILRKHFYCFKCRECLRWVRMVDILKISIVNSS